MSIAQPPHICPGYSCLPALLWTPPSFLCQKVEHWGQSHEPLTDGFQEELKANKHGRNGMWNSPVFLTRKSLCMNTSLPISVFICDIFPIQHPLLSGKWWRRGLVKWLTVREKRRSQLLVINSRSAQISNSFRKCLLLPSRQQSLLWSQTPTPQLPAAPASASPELPGVSSVEKRITSQSSYGFS